jgi:hypothetical protein
MDLDGRRDPCVSTAVQPEIVSRYDVAVLGNAEKTSQGFLRMPAHLTRAGILEYRRADGTTVRELRPSSEVFAPQSLATLRAAPVTDLHPTEMISPANVRKLSIGIVSEDVRADGELVAAAVTVQEADAIAAVERGERREISCGYRCRIDATPGTYRGQKYDQVQRDIVYNHVALGPRNWGRAGRDIALRIDAQAGETQPDADATVFRLDAADALSITTTPPTAAGKRRAPVDMTTIDLDGAHVEVPRDVAPKILQALSVRTDALGEVVIERDERDAKIATLQDRVDQLEAALREAPAKIEAAARERSAVIERVKPVLGDDATRLDGMSVRAMQEAFLAKVNPAFVVKDRTDDQISIAFDALASIEQPRTDGGAIGAARATIAPVRQPAAARADSSKWIPEWRKPLAYAAPDYKP